MLPALIANWWSLITIALKAHSKCPHHQFDERALCLPRLLPGLLTADETAAIIAATETAASKRNYTSSRHTYYATVDLPVAAVYADGGAHAAAAKRAVHKARNATINDLVHRCGATDPTLHDGFVIKYSTSRQAGLEQHGDGGRYSATIALSRPRRTGVHVPDYASLEPQTCELRKRGFANETCNAEFPERRFSREHFSAEYPLLTYDEFCPANCLGQSCDEVEPHLRTKCDCGVCASTSTTRENDDYDFEGGGTRFSSLRDVVFSPEMGGAVVHGARLKHGGEDVVAGDRFVLAFFFDEALCQAAEKGATDVLYTSLVVVFVLVPLLVWVAFFADFEDSKEKVACRVAAMVFVRFL